MEWTFHAAENNTDLFRWWGGWVGWVGCGVGAWVDTIRDESSTLPRTTLEVRLDGRLGG